MTGRSEISDSLLAVTVEEVGIAALDWLSGATTRIITIAAIVIVTYLLLRLLRSLVQRVVQEILESREGSSRELNQRASTLAGIIETSGRYVIIFIATLTVLSNLGINLRAVLASAGIVGIAIAFGAQSLVRDMFQGFFILLEGQYAVGDWVEIGEVAGTVEELSLRRTVLRSVDGASVTVPNGDIRVVENLSKGWSRAVIDISVAPEADEHEVIAVLHDVLDDVQSDPEIGSKILEPPTILGMTAVEANQITFRAFVKTEPLEQWAIERELRRRIRIALIERGVPLPPRTIDILSTAN